MEVGLKSIIGFIGLKGIRLRVWGLGLQGLELGV